MIVDQALYRGGARESVELDEGVLERLRAEDTRSGFVWVGMHEPDEAELRHDWSS